MYDQCVWSIYLPTCMSHLVRYSSRKRTARHPPKRRSRLFVYLGTILLLGRAIQSL